jgi:hypothetical protein
MDIPNIQIDLGNGSVVVVVELLKQDAVRPPVDPRLVTERGARGGASLAARRVGGVLMVSF